MPASTAHRARIQNLNNEKLLSVEVYPAPPPHLDEQEAEVFADLLCFRVPADWRSEAELLMVAQLAELFVETKRLKTDLSDHGLWYSDFDGKEKLRPAYFARQNNIRLISQLTSRLRLTEAGLAQKTAGGMARVAAAYEQQRQNEQAVLNGPNSALLARPQIVKPQE